MTKLRKQRRKKVYRYNVNRKRLRNRIENQGKLACKEVKDAWDHKKSVNTNLKEMGLSSDPNKTIKIPNYKEKLKTSISSNDNEWTEEASDLTASKAYIAEALEADARAPRVKKFRLPKGQVAWITYLMDKYGKNYRAMALDRKNYYQETWKQIRAKIRRFKSIPEQYSVYLKERNISEEDMPKSDLDSDGEL